MNTTTDYNDRKHDLIIGAFSNYGWQEVKAWALSAKDVINRPDVRFIALTYNAKQDAIDNLKSIGFEVYESELATMEYVHNQRFRDIHYLLSQFCSEDLTRNIICTDVRDVIFQADPFIKVKDLGDVYTIGENVSFANEDWNHKNVELNYPSLYKHEVHKDNETCNVGVIGGRYPPFKEFCFLLYSLISQKSGAEMYADQAALNLLHSVYNYNKLTVYTGTDFCFHQGTNRPVWNSQNLREQAIVTAKGDVIYNSVDESTLVPIVHQYDRNPALKTIIESKYKNR